MKLPKTKKSKYSSFVTKTGKLVKHLLPAAYCDTSFLIDYWNSAIHDPALQLFSWNKRDPTDQVFYDYLKADSRTKKIYGVRKVMEDYKNKLNLVYSPACRFELEEVITALKFRKYGVEVTESSLILKKGTKDIGDIITQIINDYNKELKSVGIGKVDPNLKMIYNYFFYTTDRIEEGLFGMFEVDIVNYSFSKKDFFKVAPIANQQVGLADLHHLIVAHILGCKYFFTLDSDFERVKNEILNLYRLEVVTDPQKMITILT